MLALVLSWRGVRDPANFGAEMAGCIQSDGFSAGHVLYDTSRLKTPTTNNGAKKEPGGSIPAVLV